MAKREMIRPLRVVVTGHVDHGKSTLIGRLLHDTGSISDSRLADIRGACERRGVPFDWAFLLDALQAERDQNITIDTCQIWFQSTARPYVIIDAPGHFEFLKNMVTGASSAEAAILLIAADKGIEEQTRRHAYLLHMLGIRDLVVLVNKMDLVGFQRSIFESIRAECVNFLDEIGLRPSAVIPISAREGSHVVLPDTQSLSWYQGPTLIQALDAMTLPASTKHQPLRFPVQDVYRPNGRPVIVGRVESGTLSVGDRLVFGPSEEVAVVETIERWLDRRGQEPARAGESIGITVGGPTPIERGQVGFHSSAPPSITSQLQVSLLWMGPGDLHVGTTYRLKLTTQEVDCKVVRIRRVVDVGTLSIQSTQSHLRTNDIAEVDIETSVPIVADIITDCLATARFVLLDGYDIAGGGIITGVAPTSS